MTTQDYDAAINTFIEQIKGDKSVSLPWRNFAAKHFMEGLADLHMGLATSYARAPLDMENGNDRPEAVFTPRAGNGCLCPEGGRHRACPVHRGKW